MKEFTHMFLFGCGMLIMLYLGLKNADGVAKIFTAGSPLVTGTVKALQGR